MSNIWGNLNASTSIQSDKNCSLILLVSYFVYFHPEDGGDIFLLNVELSPKQCVTNQKTALFKGLEHGDLNLPK
jgi:hypothetical protein